MGDETRDDPVGELNPDFSTPGAEPASWAAVRDRLAGAKTYWVTTVRPDGRPHATTIAGVWLDDAVHFMTGPAERKAKNLTAGNRHVLVICGDSAWEGMDVVVEGMAVDVTDVDRLRRFAEAMTRKYDDTFGVHELDGHLEVAGVSEWPLAFEVRAAKVFAFANGKEFSQTRFLFNQPAG